MCIGGLTERQMLQLALEESKNAALAAKAAAGKSEQSSDEDDSDCDSGDGSSAYGARASAGKARRAKAKQKSLTQKAAGALCEQAFSPCCHRTLLLHMRQKHVSILVQQMDKYGLALQVFLEWHTCV